MTIQKIYSFGFGALIAILIMSHVHIYGAGGNFNQGAYVDLPLNHFCGIEWNGTPGWFCDVDY